jgi:hypothetical protein
MRMRTKPLYLDPSLNGKGWQECSLDCAWIVGFGCVGKISLRDDDCNGFTDRSVWYRLGDEKCVALGSSTARMGQTPSRS